MVLPTFFMLQSGGKYLSVTENIPATLPSGFLKFDQEQIWSPRAKFAAEPAKTGDGRLFHIRSLYNNKYLVMESNSWIVASAKKPEEDKSKATCTMFEPHSLAGDDDQTVRLRHVGTGISLSPDDQGVLLSATGSSFILSDNNSVLVLPSKVAFRSQDLNGDYLAAKSLYDNLIYQQFQSGIDITNRWVAKELLTTADGNYRIKDLYSGKFWRRRDNWIKAEVDDGSIETLFSFVQIKDNVVALRNLGNDGFCGAYTESLSINCLNARYPTLSKETRLIVEEVVIRRIISDLKYRLSDARIYDEQIIEVGRGYGTNTLTQDSTILTLNFHSTDSRTTSWNSSMSINFGVNVTLETTIVPVIEKSEIELSTEFGTTHEWGGSHTTDNNRETRYPVRVPPLTTVMVTMLATTAVCDVPFSYTQRDLLPTGEWVETRKDDGLFTGINSYDIRYKLEVVPYQDTK